MHPIIENKFIEDKPRWARQKMRTNRLRNIVGLKPKYHPLPKVTEKDLAWIKEEMK